MTKPIGMTYHESYGSLPTNLLRLYKRYNVSPADHDRILAAFEARWDDPSIPWRDVLDFVLACIDGDNVLRLSQYL